MARHVLVTGGVHIATAAMHAWPTNQGLQGNGLEVLHRCARLGGEATVQVRAGDHGSSLVRHQGRELLNTGMNFAR